MTQGITPLIPNPQLSQSQDLIEIRLPYNLVAGGSVNSAVYVTADNQPSTLIEGGTGLALVNITQASVDALLGVANDVIVANAFGTTAMAAANTYGFVIACSGSIRRAQFAFHMVNIAGVVTNLLAVPSTVPLTNVAFTGAQVVVTPAGNLVGRIQLTNVSAPATVGNIFLRILASFK